jgi:hypothetical protein
VSMRPVAVPGQGHMQSFGPVDAHRSHRPAEAIANARRSQWFALTALRFGLLAAGQHRMATSATFSKRARLAPSRASVDMPWMTAIVWAASAAGSVPAGKLPSLTLRLIFSRRLTSTPLHAEDNHAEGHEPR